ncbi:MAG: alpha/beta fold hydrolase [Bacteroidales bacterium]|nr:alpha/beta fold hydrolase [Bacteroidales bacterium]
MPPEDEGHFILIRKSCQLFIYDYQPIEKYKHTIFVISGITGINHQAERDIIDHLSNHENRIVVIHPRGTGYSDGERGDISKFSDFINDYIEIITKDQDYNSAKHKIVLYGHSMSTAILLAVAHKLENIGGAILVNPPYILKKAKGMSPDFGEYMKYGWFYLFQKHKPIVNMAGDPTKIENSEDREESELRINDPLLVKYFSMYMMTESGKLMNSMIDYARTAAYPLLLIYGEKDNIVDKKGCDLLFEAWKFKWKQYLLVENGTHGKSTVIRSKDSIKKWINEL